jgi:UDP-N-acetylglucosamine 4,6-dehydratase
MTLQWNELSILITGGTGSFGNECTNILLKKYHPKKVIIFSRDELKQHDMRRIFPDDGDLPIRYFIGDVRDVDRLRRAFSGIDIVVHAAALKQVPACEYNPFEAVLTNVIGAKNVIDAAIDQGVKKVLALSTDKAVNPVNLYGATKLCAEKLFVQGNSYAGAGGTRFSCTRYGNVVGSRGSVVPLFLDQRKKGSLTVTDPRMTRFWLTVERGAEFVISCIEKMHGGEIFVPKIPSMNITDLAKAIAPNCHVEEIGIRPGEKMHEVMVSEDEARHTLQTDGMYIIKPAHSWWHVDNWGDAEPVEHGFCYASNLNKQILGTDELKKMIAELNLR